MSNIPGIDRQTFSGGRTASTSSAAPAGAPSRDDISEFQNALRSDGRENQPQSGRDGGGSREQDSRSFSMTERDSGSSGQAGEAASMNSLLSGQTLLNSLFGAPGTQPVDGTTGTQDSGIGEMMDKLVDRILVSDPKAANQEVRLTLSRDVLPGTEVHISRGADGLLTVRLVCTDASSFQTLVSSQDALKSMLNEQESHVRVEVLSEQQEDGDSNRRSRGYREYQEQEE